MSTAAIERHALRTVGFAPALALAGLTAFLYARLLPDIAGKPFHEDEAVAGLISARPLGDVLHTVVLDRGGAPLHFLWPTLLWRSTPRRNRCAALARFRAGYRAALLRPRTPG